VDEIAVKRGIKPDGMTALRGNEDVKQSLGRSVPESGEINNVPAVGEQDAVVTFLDELVLKFFDLSLVPFQWKAISGRGFQIVRRKKQAGGFGGRRAGQYRLGILRTGDGLVDGNGGTGRCGAGGGEERSAIDHGCGFEGFCLRKHWCDGFIMER